MEYKFSHNNRIYKIKIEDRCPSYVATIDDGKPYNIERLSILPNTISFLLNEKLKTIYLVQGKDKTYLTVDGEYYVLEREKAEITKSKVIADEKSNTVVSPMPGLLIKMPVSIGEKVTAGTTLAIVEAMKMQNELRAPRDGIVKKINFKEGDQVDAFVPIVELET